MSPDRTLAIAVRILRQIRRDRRSLGLIIVAPLVVMALVGFSFIDQPVVLNRIAPALLGVFSLLFTFMLTGVSFLRERAQGTQERLLTTPVSTADVLVGYLLGFLVLAGIQSLLLLAFAIGVLEVEYQGSLWQILLLLFLLTIVGVNLGIFVSTFANNELQVVQFIPIVLSPQIFLSGVILPVSQMPGYLQGASNFLPLTYAVRGLRETMIQGKGLAEVGSELGMLALFAVALIAAAATTARRA
ncbi:MAG: ABC transporter permease [Dehalococcoidia bacterium]